MATVTRSTRTRARSAKATAALPPLDSGDHLSGAEFDRRYESMPGVRAELIEGIVYVSSPVTTFHGESHIDLSVWAGTYKVFTPGVRASSDGTVHLDPDNRPQPDIHVKVAPSHGGRTGVTEDGKYVMGAPELVIEIAVSSASKDLHSKKRSYRRNEVWEYVVWRVLDDRIDWFVLRDGRYRRLKPTPEGLLKSERFPGLWLDEAAALDGDMVTVLRVLQEGLASPEHAAFVAKLAAEAARIAQIAPAPPQEPRP
jgi:Uma2 family endonuclease